MSFLPAATNAEGKQYIEVLPLTYFKKIYPLSGKYGIDS
jgi:hypothetical protein